MPSADRRADYGPHAPLPPELDPRRGRPPKVPQQIRVGDLQAHNPNAPTRGRHRAGPPERENPSSPPGRAVPPGSIRRATLLSGRVLLVMISVAALIGSGIAWATYRQFTQGIQHGQALPDLPKGTKRIDGKDQNILLLGNDSIAGATPAEVRALGTTRDRSDSATDTMMILHIPADGKKATIISFPRDSWVNIPGHGMFKLNAAYVDGFNDAAAQGAKDLLTKQSAGILLVAQTLSELTGLHIDHYVQINLLGFYEISDAIGGVNLCLNQAQNDHWSGINLKAGWNNNVRGSQALAFVRQRHGLQRGDIDRIVRQQYFLSAVFKKATSSSTLLNPFRLQKLLNSVKRSLITDPKLDILNFVQQFTKIAGGNVSFATVPIVDPGFWEGNQQVVKVDPAAIKAFVGTLVGGPVDKKLQAAKAVAPSQVSVTVLNEANRDHVATNNTNTLSRAGFLATVGPDTDQRTEQTAIEYPDGMQAQAKTLAGYVPGATLELSSSVNKVTLVLGSDGLAARATLPAPQAKPKTSSRAVPSSSPSPTQSGVTSAAQNSKACVN